ncbi:hypothetical protein [Pseudomonas sp. 57B-090624]|uniref:hypothetical protein n=1 Tax=Pseudomonas sp. 57B-090624 TaxID=2213080 RepID=UPI0011B60383|nr:hypothetical protein [Pseudomonas sp. 57B-090624]
MTSNKSVATRAGDVLKVGVHEGEYIEAHKLNKKVPVKVLKTVDYSIPRTINAGKSLLKSNLGQLLLTGVIMGAVSAVDWVMEEGVKPGGGTERKLVKKVPGTVEGIGLPYKGAGFSGMGCSAARQYGPGVYSGGGWVYVVSAGTPYTKAPFTYVGNCDDPYLSQAFASDFPINVSPDSTVEVTPEEIDQKFGDYAAAQDAEWLKGLLRESCQGSQSPEACMQSLRDQVTTSGPATVTADKTVSTGTYLKPDGTYGSTRTETTTNYNIKYGPTYFDFTENKAVTIYKDGEKVSDETTGETDDVTEEKPAEEDKEDADPCVTGCDGPAYKDLYQPTDKTKEGEIDSYSSRVKNIPLMKAVIGLFDVQVQGAQCPIWETHQQMELLGETMNIDLVFDYHCLPWFIDKKTYVQAIVLIGFMYLAIRIGLL